MTVIENIRSAIALRLMYWALVVAPKSEKESALISLTDHLVRTQNAANGIETPIWE